MAQTYAKNEDRLVQGLIFATSFLLLVLAQACAGGGGGAVSSGASENESGDEAGVIIFSDDFESDQPLGERYFEYDDASGSFARAPRVGINGSYAMQARWQPGQVEAGSLKLAFGRTPAGLGAVPPRFTEQDFRDVYWRLYLRNEPGWNGIPDKLSRATSFASNDSWAQAMIAHVWSSNTEPVLVLDPASGIGGDNNLVTTQYNDFDNLRWLGAESGSTAVFAVENAGRWFCIEAHARLNSPGAADGVFELWIDGQPEASISGLDWVGGWQDYGINAVFVENYWNAGAPGERVRYIDNLVVSTGYIGCD
ncbi:MAG TPA: hypothetical protein PLP17_02130 [Oligoflexia bacterium]|nr:hypothetical protein [Oligoflexia bacterium]